MSLLTNTEFSTLYSKSALSFANKSLAELTADIYGIRSSNATAAADRLWLYFYALESWDNVDLDNNYMTERQMVKIVSKVQNAS